MDIVVGILFAILFFATAVGIVQLFRPVFVNWLARIIPPKYKFLTKLIFDNTFWGVLGLLISLIIYIPIWDWWYNDIPFSNAFYFKIFNLD